MKTIIKIILLCTFTASVNASLIQWDAFNAGDELAVKDLDTGTVWLDLSQTAGTGYFQAGDLYDNWGYASNVQVEDLLSKSFPTFSVNTTANHQTNCYAGNACFQDAEAWLDLFGATLHQQNARVKYGFALYQDEADMVRMGGTRVNGSLGNAYIYGDQFTPNYSSFTTAAPDYFYSTFLTLQLPQRTVDGQLSESGVSGLFLAALGFVAIRRRKMRATT